MTVAFLGRAEEPARGGAPPAAGEGPRPGSRQSVQPGHPKTAAARRAAGRREIRVRVTPGRTSRARGDEGEPRARVNVPGSVRVTAPLSSAGSRHVTLRGYEEPLGGARGLRVAPAPVRGPGSVPPGRCSLRVTLDPLRAPRAPSRGRPGTGGDPPRACAVADETLRARKPTSPRAFAGRRAVS